LFAVKIAAWLMTNSVAVLTDALESTVNVTTGFLGLYSLILSARPRDENHPYGHGKVEFLSAAIEGILILLAAVLIIYEAILNLNNPHKIQQIDTGILFIGFTAIVNYLVGMYAVRTGKRLNTLPIEASGRHLQTDTLSTIGILLGLLLIKFTKLTWVDSAVAIVFAVIIMYTGFKILRASLAGIMDESDRKLLKEIVAFLQENRRKQWVDLHNMRIIKYGSVLHIDCHMTVPWFFNVHEAHSEVQMLESLVRTKYGEQVELFVHTDGCLDFSCAICNFKECKERKMAFTKQIDWTVENISNNLKHA
jgi:cation diffusion facilitator family transporter